MKVTADREGLESRVLLLAPTVKDAELTCDILGRAGVTCAACPDWAQVSEQLTAGAGAVLIAEEALHGGDGSLAQWLTRQPTWSDLPVLILARTGANSAAVAWTMEKFSNVTVLERPTRVAALVSAVNTALRARRRQYQLRDQLAQRERVADQLNMAMASAQAGSWQIDLTTGALSASDRAIELHGLPPGTPFDLEQAWARVHPDDRASVEAALQATTLFGIPYRTEHRLLQPDGSFRWVADHAERRVQGGRNFIIGMVQDISERKQADEEWKKTTAILNSLVASAPMGIVLFDAEMRFRHLNAPLAEMNGLPVEAHLGKTVTEVVPALHESAKSLIERVLVKGETIPDFIVEGETPKAPGVKRVWRESWFPVAGADGRPVGAAAIIQEITEQRRAEERLRSSDALNRSLMDGSSDCVLVMDTDGRLLSMNLPGMSLLEIEDCTTFIGREWMTVWPEAGREEVRRAVECTRGGGVYAFEMFCPTAKGTPRWWDVAVSPVRDVPGGPVVRILSVSRDITDRKRADAALREGEQRTRLATEATQVGIWEWNLATGRTHWDAQMFRIYGIPPTLDGCVGYDAWSGAVLPEDLPGQERALQQTIDRRENGTREFRIRRASDGECRVVRSVETVRTDAGGEVQWVLGTNLDITEKRRAQDDLQRLATELSQADRRKDEFLATLAHELRNPLAPLRNGLHMIKLAKPEGAIEGARSMMDRQLTQLVRLVDDLLDISRVTSGKLELRKARIELRAVINSAVETSHSGIEQAGLELTVDMPDEAILVDGDAARLAQVVSNLLNNSAKYVHRGGHVRLTVGHEDGTAVVSVKDDGIGIPPAMLGRVFEMFVQVDRTLEKTTGGLGIGLSLVKGLLALHGGTIEAKSDGEALGTEFVIRLPLAMPVVDATDRVAGQTGEAVPPAVRRILVVDDNEDAADSLGQLLEVLGHEVRIAHDGEAGVAAAAQFRPDVVLMDIGMPKMNGHEAARRMRLEPWGQGMVLVALTGWGQDDDRQKSSDAGFDHHLVKPLAIDTLSQLMAGLKCADAPAVGVRH